MRGVMGIFFVNKQIWDSCSSKKSTIKIFMIYKDDKCDVKSSIKEDNYKRVSIVLKSEEKNKRHCMMLIDFL